jgi:hypothetical protein
MKTRRRLNLTNLKVMMLGVEDIQAILWRMEGIAELLYRKEDYRKYICQARVLRGTADIKSVKLPQLINR